jgi:rhomboid family GlyGly-CTERM serine protease
MRLSPTAGLYAVVLAVLAAELFLPAELFEYRRALAAREPWRLFTGHYVHLSFLHVALNVVALLLLYRLFADRLRPREFFAILGLAPILMSLVFWLVLPELQWYRGLSGVLHAVYFAGCVVWIAASAGRAGWLPVAALIGGALKVLLEQPWDASFPVHEMLRVAVVPQAHLIGAIVGAAAGLALRQRRQEAQAEKPQQLDR